MEIQQQSADHKGSFYIETDKHRVAEMVYSFDNPLVMVIEHTEVDQSLRGKNIGVQLFNKAVNYAREQELKIQPVCSFVRKLMEKDPEKYKDILYKI